MGVAVLVVVTLLLLILTPIAYGLIGWAEKGFPSTQQLAGLALLPLAVVAIIWLQVAVIWLTVAIFEPENADARRTDTPEKDL
jgi:hypothetical protein